MEATTKSRVIVEECFFLFLISLMQENAISAKFNPNSWLRVLFIKNARRVKYLSTIWEGRRGGKKGSSFSELAPTNSLLISAILSIHSFERNFLPGRCTDFPLFSREREPGLRIEHRVPRNAYIVDNYRNHRQVDGIATRKENERRKRVASISVDGFVLSTCLVSILQFEIILLQRWLLLSSLIVKTRSSSYISNLCSPSISHSSWKENGFFFVDREAYFLIKKKERKRRGEWQTEHYLYRAWCVCKWRTCVARSAASRTFAPCPR